MPNSLVIVRDCYYLSIGGLSPVILILTKSLFPYIRVRILLDYWHPRSLGQVTISISPSEFLPQHQPRHNVVNR